MKSDLKIKMDKIMIPFKGTEKNILYSDRQKNDDYRLLEPRSSSLKRDILLSNNIQKGSSLNHLNITVHKNKVLLPTYSNYNKNSTPFLDKLKQNIKMDVKKQELITSNNYINRAPSVSSFNSYRNNNQISDYNKRDVNNLYFNDSEYIRPSSRSSNRTNYSSNSYYKSNNLTSKESYNNPNIQSLKNIYSLNKKTNDHVVYDINRNINSSKKDQIPLKSNLCNVLISKNITNRVNSEFKSYNFNNNMNNNDSNDVDM